MCNVVSVDWGPYWVCLGRLLSLFGPKPEVKCKNIWYCNKSSSRILGPKVLTKIGILKRYEFPWPIPTFLYNVLFAAVSIFCWRRHFWKQPIRWLITKIVITFERNEIWGWFWTHFLAFMPLFPTVYHTYTLEVFFTISKFWSCDRWRYNHVTWPKIILLLKFCEEVFRKSEGTMFHRGHYAPRSY